jgi:hypothetical protein
LRLGPLMMRIELAIARYFDGAEVLLCESSR